MPEWIITTRHGAVQPARMVEVLHNLAVLPLQVTTLALHLRMSPIPMTACRRILVLLALSLSMALPTLARAADEIRYRVVAGDTLIGIGERFLTRPQAWPRLQALNGIEDPYRIPVGTELRIPRALLRPEPRVARVVALRGEAFADGVALAEGAEVAAGAELRTAADAHLVLAFPDGALVALPAASSARLQALHGYRLAPGEEVRVRVHDGRVEATVPPQRGPAARFRVDTPTAVIGVRGTAFRVAASPQGSRAEVTEGRVAVQAGGRQRELAAGFGVLAAADGRLGAARALPPAPAVDGLPDFFDDPLPRFALPLSAGVAAWRYQLAASADFIKVLGEHAGSAEARFPGLPDGDYFLRVRAIAADGLEGHDAVHAFRLKARPEPPFLAEPAAAGKVAAGSVAFSWSGAPEAARYRLQIAAAEGFSVPLVDRADIAATAVEHALDAGEYQWRVASLRADGDQGPWSPAAALAGRPPAELTEAPQVAGDTLVFRWNGEAGQVYDYQFAGDEAFTQVRADGRVVEPGVELPRPGPETYFMRVRAIDADGFVGAWSGAQRVVVPADFPWWMLFLPLLAL